MEDNRIIDLFMNRDETAIEDPSAKYGGRLKNISFGITDDKQTAEECENDTYLEIWNTIPPQNPVDYLFAYLARIIWHMKRFTDSLMCVRRMVSLMSL